MTRIGLIREGKIPADNRVALTPSQSKWIDMNAPGIQIVAQSSQSRCFSDKEYLMAGAEVKEDLGDCDILLGIKEVPVDQLIPGKTYLFFSHTKKKQPHNQALLKAILNKKITLAGNRFLHLRLSFICRLRYTRNTFLRFHANPSLRILPK